jgi:hypothetical protein
MDRVEAVQDVLDLGQGFGEARFGAQLAALLMDCHQEAAAAGEALFVNVGFELHRQATCGLMGEQHGICRR